MKLSTLLLLFLLPLLSLSQCQIDTLLEKQVSINTPQEVVEEDTTKKKQTPTKKEEKAEADKKEPQPIIGGFLGFILFEPYFLHPKQESPQEQG